MSDRDALIARKHEVLRQLAQTRRQLQMARNSGDPRQRREVARLERHIERLMAEEYRLRIAIDRVK